MEATGTHQASTGRDRVSDQTLVEAACHGDREAFARLYCLYAPMVHGILLAHVPWREVDDLVQDVFLAAFKKIRSLRDSARFGSWLGMITRNRAVDFHRKSRAAEELPIGLADNHRPEPEIEAEEILGTIRTLPEAYRETLTLRLVEGMTGPEIAARTGLSPASVRVNLYRGMKLLRAALVLEVD
jgi:RNA polymerase sigma-70 factor (ECF subfamily)